MANNNTVADSSDALSFAGTTLGDARARSTRLLTRAGRPAAAIDARHLLQLATGFDHGVLLRDEQVVLSAEAANRLSALVRRRLHGEPLSRIIGHREFHGLTLVVHPDVLDPRDDTETVVTLTHRLLPTQPSASHILDLGTGSGALLCAILTMIPAARGVAVDRSEAACRAAVANLARCGLSDRSTVLRAHWSASLAPGFDVIVSNPPYIARAALETLPDEVRHHDPNLALDGGVDGLDAYRAILADLPRIARPHALLVFEIGDGALAAITTLLIERSLTIVGSECDGGGHVRAIAARVQ